MRANELDLGLDLLDFRIVDTDGSEWGRVDDIELAGGPGQLTRVNALLTGSGAWPDRVPRRAARLLRPFVRKWVERVPWDDIDRIEQSIVLRAPASELGLGTPDGRNVVWWAQLDEMPLRVARLIGSRVETEDGRSLGRLFDIRAERMTTEPDEKVDEPWVVTGILVGRRALLERMGVVHGPDREHVPDHFVGWRRVSGIRADGTLVVAAAG